MPPVGPMPPVRPVRRDDGRDRRRFLLPIVAAVLVVLLGVVVAVLVLRDSSDGNTTATGSGGSTSPRATSPSTSPSTTPSATRSSESSSTPPSSSSPTPTPTTPSATSSSATSPAAGAPTAGQLTAAVEQYYQLIPDDLDAAWSRLTPSFQQGRAGGRETFDDYWDSVDRVDVVNPRGQAPGTVTALLIYRYDNGNVVRQQTTFRLVRQDGVLKINSQS